MMSEFLVCQNNSSESIHSCDMFVKKIIKFSFFLHFLLILSLKVTFKIMPVALIIKVPNNEHIWGIDSVSCFPSQVVLIGLFPEKNIIKLTIVAGIDH